MAVGDSIMMMMMMMIMVVVVVKVVVAYILDREDEVRELNPQHFLRVCRAGNIVMGHITTHQFEYCRLHIFIPQAFDGTIMDW